MSEPTITPAPKRRWFRFSLRTLFVVATVLSLPLAWIAWSLNRIHQRHEFLRSYQSQMAIMTMHEDRNFAPQGLWIFGEGGIEWLELNLEQDVADCEQIILRAKRLFPEAEFSWSYHPDGTEHTEGGGPDDPLPAIH